MFQTVATVCSQCNFCLNCLLFCQCLKNKKIKFCLYKGKVNDCLKICENLPDALKKGKKNLFLLVFIQGVSDINFLISFYIVCLQKSLFFSTF